MKLALLRPMGFCCLSLCALAAGAAESLSLEVAQAWDGLVRPGRTSEIELRLLSPLGGVASIEIAQGDQRKSFDLAIEAGSARTVVLPVMPVLDSPLKVKADLEGTMEANAEFSFSAWDSNLLTVAGETFALAPANLGKALRATGPMLPKTVQGYGPIDALLLDYGVLGEMSQEQSSALYHYLARCGRLLAKNFPHEALDRLRQVAGCGGKFLAQDDGRPLEALLPPLLKGKPLELPKAVQMEKLSNNEWEKWASWPLLALALGYFILLAMAAHIRMRPLPLFALPLFASILAVLAFGHRPPEAKLILWMETDFGHPTARYSALLQSFGMGRWQGERRLPLEASLSSADGEAHSSLNIRAGQDIEAIAYEHSYLFSKASWHWQGDIALSPVITLEEREGRLNAVNIGKTSLPEGWAMWRGKLYSLPALAAGERWSPGAGGFPHRLNDPLLRRLEKEQTAVLIPYFPDNYSVHTALSSHQGWLLIRQNQGEPSG